MSKQIDALKLALEALEGLEALLLSMGLTHLIVYGDAKEAITAIKEALAQPAVAEQHKQSTTCGEPVAWLDEYGNAFPLAAKQYSVVGKHWKPLYTTPPPVPEAHKRKPLTDKQVREITKQYALSLAFPYGGKTTPEMFARSIEAAHGIHPTGFKE